MERADMFARAIIYGLCLAMFLISPILISSVLISPVLAQQPEEGVMRLEVLEDDPWVSGDVGHMDDGGVMTGLDADFIVPPALDDIERAEDVVIENDAGNIERENIVIDRIDRDDLGIEETVIVEDIGFDDIPASAIGSPLYDALPPEIQKDIIDEAQHVHDYCVRNSKYASFVDCRCLAAKFIDTRIEQGPNDRNLMHIAAQNQEECVNEPGIAGYAWRQCQDLVVMMPEGGDEFCTCFANSYVKNFAERPKLITPVLNRAMSRALQSCDDGTGPVRGSW